jgi:hypothetical protein
MMSHALQEMRVTVHLLVFAVDTVVVFASLVLAGFIALGMPRSRNAWLAAGILLGGICAVVLGRFQYGYWIPEPYRIQIGPWEPVLNIGRNLSPALLMLLCRSLFQEPRRLPRSLLGLIVLQILLEEPIHLLVGDATPTERLLTEVAPAVLQALFGALAVYWTVAGWPTDLVEARRRMRVIVLGGERPAHGGNRAAAARGHSLGQRSELLRRGSARHAARGSTHRDSRLASERGASGPVSGAGSARRSTGAFRRQPGYHRRRCGTRRGADG